jgi:hypothetical protein
VRWPQTLRTLRLSMTSSSFSPCSSSPCVDSLSIQKYWTTAVSGLCSSAPPTGILLLYCLDKNHATQRRPIECTLPNLPTSFIGIVSLSTTCGLCATARRTLQQTTNVMKPNRTAAPAADRSAPAVGDQRLCPTRDLPGGSGLQGGSHLLLHDREDQAESRS